MFWIFVCWSSYDKYLPILSRIKNGNDKYKQFSGFYDSTLYSSSLMYKYMLSENCSQNTEKYRKDRLCPSWFMDCWESEVMMTLTLVSFYHNLAKPIVCLYTLVQFFLITFMTVYCTYRWLKRLASWHFYTCLKHFTYFSCFDMTFFVCFSFQGIISLHTYIHTHIYIYRMFLKKWKKHSLNGIHHTQQEKKTESWSIFSMKNCFFFAILKVVKIF